MAANKSIFEKKIALIKACDKKEVSFPSGDNFIGRCYHCKKELFEGYLSCAKCDIFHYCNKKCMRLDKEYHSQFCQYFQDIKPIESYDSPFRLYPYFVSKMIEKAVSDWTDSVSDCGFYAIIYENWKMNNPISRCEMVWIEKNDPVIPFFLNITTQKNIKKELIDTLKAPMEEFALYILFIDKESYTNYPIRWTFCED